MLQPRVTKAHIMLETLQEFIAFHSQVLDI